MGWVEVLERLKQAAGLGGARPVAATERRKALRVQRRVGLLGKRADGERLPLMAFNFSAKGVLVQSPQTLKKGELVSLQLNTRQDDNRQIMGAIEDSVQARVLWSRKRTNGLSYDIGMAFVIDTPERQKVTAHFLLDNCKVGIRDPREHRKSPRVLAEMRGMMMKTGDNNTIQIAVKDIALGGVLALSPKPMEVGTAVDLKVFLPKDDDALVCQGSVLRCIRLDPSTFELGIALTEVSKDHRERLVSALSKILASRVG
jgi:hypothetical protein